MNPLFVAKQTGTSLEMIEKHYGDARVLAEQLDEMIASADPGATRNPAGTPSLRAVGDPDASEEKTQLTQGLEKRAGDRARTGDVQLGKLAFEAYGVYPAMGRYLDWRDAIHMMDWDRVVASIPAGRIAPPNARSLIFYGNLQGVRAYEVVEQFDENPKKFAALLERAENDWIVLSKYPPYAALIPLADSGNRYQRSVELDYTVIYRKIR